MKKRFIISTLVVSLVIASSIQAKSKAPVLNKKKITLQVGKKYQLKVKNKGKKKVKWSSTKKKIATISKKGKVVAKKPGTTKICAKIGKKTLVCKVTVKKAGAKVPTTANSSTTSKSDSDVKTIPKPTAKPGGGSKATPTPTTNPNSIVNNPTEDPNKRDDGWVPGWY